MQIECRRNHSLLIAFLVMWSLVLGGMNCQADATQRKTSPAVVIPAVRSISKYVSCNGESDDSFGVAQAFEEARETAFTLIVDCHVRLKMGLDIARTIFIDDGTSIEFTKTGKFTIDNVFHPAFVIANSKNIKLTNWNVEYDASLPVYWDVGGYENNGRFIAAKGYAQPASAFNDRQLTPWLRWNRGISFVDTNSVWVGPTNTSAVFFITGDTSNVRVTGMRLYVPPTAGGERFVPMAFSLSANFKSHQSVARSTPATSKFMAVPHNLVFSDIELDGTYMGWQGNVQNTIFERIRSHRYADLQDASGKNVGGVGKWFAPPHLFYLNYAEGGDPALFNRNLRIVDVVDDGPRVGVARDMGGADTVSGSALSLKIGCVECSVDGYRTARPDGFLDVLPSEGLTVSNVDATFDSEFLNGVFAGWRFPRAPYRRLTFENIVITDSAQSSVQPPISGFNQNVDAGLTIRNVKVRVNQWSGKGTPIPAFSGKTNDISVNYSVLSSGARLVSTQKAKISITLHATPAKSKPIGEVLLEWTSASADKCTAAGAWNGNVAVQGSQTVKVAGGGSYDFHIACASESAKETATASVHVGP